MLECAFTIDYEIYGSGCGDLRSLVFEPAQRLKTVFDRAGAKFVNFVEAVELSQIEKRQADAAIADVRQQIRELHQAGHEIALHLHPQWANAKVCDGQWALDYAEYNLCTLPPARIAHIVDVALGWLRSAVGETPFSPVSFRGGNWLFQPTQNAAIVLADRGVWIDSSVFKGGLQCHHRLDYRAALGNGWYWRFADDVNQSDPIGRMLELPIYTEMVPFWRMLSRKRLKLQRTGYSAGRQATGRRSRWCEKAHRLRDYLRPFYPLKFDFCRMSLADLTSMVESVIEEDRRTPEEIKPIVAIGHTKDLLDIDTVEAFLDWLRAKSIPVSTLEDMAKRCPLSR